MSMSRRSVLKVAAGASIGTIGILHGYAANAAEFTFKLGHDQPSAHPQNIRTVEAAKKIAEESGGRIAIQVYPNNQLGGDTQMFAQLRSGALEMMQLSDNILANVSPASNFANLPFAFDNSAKVWEAMDGALGNYIRAQLEKLGLHVFEKTWDAGFREVFTNTRPVHNADEMKGLKLRVPGAPIQIEFFKALGASPTPINNNELYSALQTHLVDGAEQPLISIESTKYYEISKYVSLTKHQATTFEMMVNAAAWRRLPPNLQEIVTRNLNKYALLERADIDSGYATLEAQLKKQGMTFIVPDRKSFRTVIQRAGLYAKWRDAYGPEAFGLLERAVGKLA